MSSWLIVIALAVAFLGSPVARGQTPCRLQELGELPVTVAGGHATVDAEIDGRPVRMVIDTGSASTFLTRPAANQLGLASHEVGLKFYGVGGKDQVARTLVKQFRVANLVAKDFDMLVTGQNELGPAQGVLGAAFLMQADVEFDLPEGRLRFFKPQNCQGDQVVYWGKAYSVAPMVGSTEARIEVSVLLNGAPTPAQMDTGTPTSVVTTAAAAKAGVAVTSEGVSAIGSLHGIGPKAVPFYSGVFSQFVFGDETIRNAQLEIADLFHDNKEVQIGSNIPTNVVDEPQMLLGADFFRSHRIYVSRAQRKVYASYVGGPVFSRRTVAVAANEEAGPCPGVDLDSRIRACTVLIQSTHKTTRSLALAYDARGVAYREKRLFDQAVADFNKALELNPDDANAFFQRGVVNDWRGHRDTAIADYSKSIALKPDDPRPYNKRGGLYIDNGSYDLAIADLTRSIALRPGEPVIYYNRGVAYGLKARQGVGNLRDSKGLRDLGMADFNETIRLTPDFADAFRGRALIEQGNGNFDRAAADLDQAVRFQPSLKGIFKDRGWNLFYVGRFGEAAADFTTQVRLEPSDPYGMLWQHLARSRAGKRDKADLASASSKLDLTAWPGPVIRLFLGKASPADVRSSAVTGDTEKSADQACEAVFYIGEYVLLSGNQAGAKPLLLEAVETCPKADIEAMAAEAEMKRLP